MSKVYIAGHMLNKGSQIVRAMERDAIKSIGKYKLYTPQDNKDINDKQNAVQEGLAERIVKQDTKAILESDIIVIEPAENAFGTMAELGQIHMFNLLVRTLMDYEEKSLDNWEFGEIVSNWLMEHRPKKVYAHFDDIRRTDISEVGDRRSWSVNQYIYGLVLDLTNGVGFKTFEDIIDELK